MRHQREALGCSPALVGPTLCCQQFLPLFALQLSGLCRVFSAPHHGQSGRHTWPVPALEYLGPRTPAAPRGAYTVSPAQRCPVLTGTTPHRRCIVSVPPAAASRTAGRVEMRLARCTEAAAALPRALLRPTRCVDLLGAPSLPASLQSPAAVACHHEPAGRLDHSDSATLCAAATAASSSCDVDAPGSSCVCVWWPHCIISSAACIARSLQRSVLAPRSGDYCILPLLADQVSVQLAWSTEIEHSLLPHNMPRQRCRRGTIAPCINLARDGASPGKSRQRQDGQPRIATKARGRGEVSASHRSICVPLQMC